MLLSALGTSVLADDAKLESLAEAAPPQKQSLSDAQIQEVVKTHFDDIQGCWLRVPAKDRAAGANLVLALSVAPKGDVVDTTIISDAPAEARTCVANLTRQWTFPVVGLASDFEYPIALHGH